MMDFLFNSFFGVIILGIAAYLIYMLLIKTVSKVYNWIKWQRMNPTERKYEKIRQNRRRNYNGSSKKSYNNSPDSPGGSGD